MNVGTEACPNCGTSTDAGAPACPRCGLPRNFPVFDPHGAYLGTTFGTPRQAFPDRPGPLGPGGGPGMAPGGPAAMPGMPGYRSPGGQSGPGGDQSGPWAGAALPGAPVSPVPPTPGHTPLTVADPSRPNRPGRRALLVILGAVVVIVLGVAAGLIIANLPDRADTAVPASPPPAPSSPAAAVTPTPQASTTPSPTPEPSPADSPSPIAEPTSTPVEQPATPSAPASAGTPGSTATTAPTRSAVTEAPSDTKPISGARNYTHEATGASCVVPTGGWTQYDTESGAQWNRDSGEAEVACDTSWSSLAELRQTVETEWATRWDVTFSSGDATQYRASGYTDAGNIFWLGAKKNPGSSHAVVTYWIYPKDQKAAFDSYIERAWSELRAP